MIAARLISGLVLAVLSIAPAGRGATVSPAATRAGNSFLARYVTPDGRVVRRDQGRDTVSEGQAYALLVSQALGDQRRFDRIWSWTRANLQRPDGLLAWHWVGGRVADPMPAADADLDAAWALTLAGSRFARPDYVDDASRLAAALLDRETAVVNGRLLLVAGPWARSEPYVVNPSYAAPGAFAALGRATGDRRWVALDDSSLRVIQALTPPGRLPPDWAVVTGSGTVQATSQPGDSTGARYGLDAGRVPIWASTGCSPAWRAVAASTRSLLDADPSIVGRTLTLSGEPISTGPDPTLTVAGAAAWSAAGATRERDRLLDRAERLDGRRPTYYGGAWVALGRLLLTDSTRRWCG